MPRGDAPDADAAIDATHAMATAPPPSRMAPLAPERTGLVAVDQPILWFYLSDPWPGGIEFALNKPGAEEPELEILMEGPFVKGVYGVALADFNVSLAPGVEYEWLLAIPLDPEERSADFLGSATIRYVEPEEDLKTLFAETPEDELQLVYAEKGYFYDAMNVLSKRIESMEPPAESPLRRQRGALLNQVNLPLAASYDRRKGA